jgi:tetratricopeptide (TPR) repeat protein
MRRPPLSLPHQQAGQLEKAQKAYEQAAQSQEKIGSPWHAAKHLETCAAISKDLGQLDRVADYSRQAGSLYALAGRMAAGAQLGCLRRAAVPVPPCIPAQAAQAARQQQDSKGCCLLLPNALHSRLLPAAADALARGAKVLEEASPADATALYLEAVEMYENDGKEAQVGQQHICCQVCS